MQKKRDGEDKYIYKFKTGFFIFCNFSSYVWRISKKFSQMHASILAAQCFTTF